MQKAAGRRRHVLFSQDVTVREHMIHWRYNAMLSGHCTHANASGMIAQQCGPPGVQYVVPVTPSQHDCDPVQKSHHLSCYMGPLPGRLYAVRCGCHGRLNWVRHDGEEAYAGSNETATAGIMELNPYRTNRLWQSSKEWHLVGRGGKEGIRKNDSTSDNKRRQGPMAFLCIGVQLDVRMHISNWHHRSNNRKPFLWLRFGAVQECVKHTPACD